MCEQTYLLRGALFLYVGHEDTLPYGQMLAFDDHYAQTVLTLRAIQSVKQSLRKIIERTCNWN